MFCRNCGASVDDNAVMCPQCGTVLKPQGEGQAANNAGNMAPPPVYDAVPQQPVMPGDPSKNGMAIAALILSIAGVVCCPGVCSILGIIFGILSLKSQKRSLAMAGLIIGIVGVVFAIIGMIMWFAGASIFGSQFDEIIYELERNFGRY